MTSAPGTYDAAAEAIAARLASGGAAARIAAASSLFARGDAIPHERRAVMDLACAYLRLHPGRDADGEPAFDADDESVRREILHQIRERFLASSGDRWDHQQIPLTLARTYLPDVDLSKVHIRSDRFLSGAWVAGDVELSHATIECGDAEHLATLDDDRPHFQLTGEEGDLHFEAERAAGSVSLFDQLRCHSIDGVGVTVRGGRVRVSGHIGAVRLPVLTATQGVSISGLVGCSFVGLLGSDLKGEVSIDLEPALSAVDISWSAVHGDVSIFGMALDHGAARVAIHLERLTVKALHLGGARVSTCDLAELEADQVTVRECDIDELRLDGALVDGGTIEYSRIGRLSVDDATLGPSWVRDDPPARVDWLGDESRETVIGLNIVGSTTEVPPQGLIDNDCVGTMGDLLLDGFPVPLRRDSGTARSGAK
ncbi:hypothetical protein QQX13_02480 [Demequina sp. SYSU T00068]|uniref:hypothetical protein n=1 Tax=Demequina lignilytica TaxID=3051663 RepID=UPI00262B592B|nr:hypothetical protein [Demequina sp. SYSU T00068]MDN4489691.1 hypothetical protein [Demequina sp. SYSU T00068]